MFMLYAVVIALTFSSGFVGGAVWHAMHSEPELGAQQADEYEGL